MMSFGHLLPWRPKKDEGQPPPSDGTSFAEILKAGVPAVAGSSPDPAGLIPPPSEDPGSPFPYVPRWVLAFGTAAFLVAGGAWLNDKIASQNKIEQAVQDAPGKYTARLGERLADVEATIRSHERQMADFRAMAEHDRAQREKDQKETEALLRQLLVQVSELRKAGR